MGLRLLLQAEVVDPCTREGPAYLSCQDGPLGLDQGLSASLGLVGRGAHNPNVDSHRVDLSSSRHGRVVVHDSRGDGS